MCRRGRRSNGEGRELGVRDHISQTTMGGGAKYRDGFGDKPRPSSDMVPSTRSCVSRLNNVSVGWLPLFGTTLQGAS